MPAIGCQLTPARRRHPPIKSFIVNRASIRRCAEIIAGRGPEALDSRGELRDHPGLARMGGEHPLLERPCGGREWHGDRWRTRSRHEPLRAKPVGASMVESHL